MCAINPLHKKRIIFDFYTSHPMSKATFDEAVAIVSLTAEQQINSHGTLRVHIKETEQEAE